MLNTGKMVKSFSRDIMKKTRAFTLLLLNIISLSLASCNDYSFSSQSSLKSEEPSSQSFSIDNEPILDQYSLTIIDEGKLIYEKPHLLGESSKTNFNAGDVVYFSTAVIMDASIIFKLNDDKMIEANANLDNDDSLYTPHSFVMPAQNSVLKVSTINGFFSTEAIPLGEIYDWIYYLEPGDIVSATYKKNTVGNPSFSKFNEYYTANEEELTGLYHYLKNNTVKATDYRIPPGAQQTSITLKTKNNKTYGIGASANRLNGNAFAESYLLKEPLPEFSTLMGYSFDTNSLYNLKVTDLMNGEDVTKDFDLNNLDKMIFEQKEGVVFYGEMNEFNKYKFENSCGCFIFESQKYLTIQDTNAQSSDTYEIVNDYDLLSFHITQEE